MASDVALRIAYFSLNLVGGLTMTIMILTLCLEIRRLREGLFLVAICSSRVISAVVSSLLLFSGSMTGKKPSETLCIVQSGLHNAQTPFISYTVFSYAAFILLLISHSSTAPIWVIQVVKATLLAIPFIILITLSIISIATTQQLDDTISPLFYCALDHKPLKNAAAILSAIGLFATIIAILWIFYSLSPRSNQSTNSGDSWAGDLSISLLLLGMYTAVRAGFWIANFIKETVTSDMLDAVDGIILFFIITTQGWLRRSWSNCLGNLSRHALEKPQSNSPPPIQVYRHSTRQVISVPPVIDIRAIRPIQEEDEEVEIQSPKLLALATALGLDPVYSPPIMREVVNPSPPKFHFQERHVYSVEPAYGSYTSFKSMQYGVALGHPSRDVSRDPTPAYLEGHSDHATEPPVVVLPPESDTASEYGEDEPDHNSQVSHPLSAFAGPLFVQSHTHTPLHLSSALASSGGDYLSTEQPRARTPPSSFIPVSMDSRSRSATPRSQSAANHSYEGPIHLYGSSVQTVEVTTTEEGVFWSTSSESNPPILLDASASSLSWPNVSPPSSNIRHDDMTGRSSASRLGMYSPSISIPMGATTPSTESSRQHVATRTLSPSPLSLDERSNVRRIPLRLDIPSPEPHPFARGISPFRPPGLVHLRSYSDGM